MIAVKVKIRLDLVSGWLVVVHTYLYCLPLSQYLGPFTSTADVSGRRALRSIGTNRLAVPPDFPPSVAELIPLPPLKSGTHRLSSHVAVLQASLENVSNTTIFLSIALCRGFGYLGHFKKLLID